jgi:hypothetical protein
VNLFLERRVAEFRVLGTGFTNRSLYFGIFCFSFVLYLPYFCRFERFKLTHNSSNKRRKNFSARKRAVPPLPPPRGKRKKERKKEKKEKKKEKERKKKEKNYYLQIWGL